jgi:uncharacterized membrane protein
MCFLEKMLISLSGDLNPSYCNVFLYGSFAILFVVIISMVGTFSQILSKKVKKNNTKYPNYTIFSFIALIMGVIVPYITNRLLYTMCTHSLK